MLPGGHGAHPCRMRIASRLALPLLAAAGTIGMAGGAMATTTRLVTCGGQACLMIKGERPAPDAAVAINGHGVAVQGGRSWQLRLPLATLRAWSEPYAREVMIATAGKEQAASLPIGLLGHTTDLAALDIRLR